MNSAASRTQVAHPVCWNKLAPLLLAITTACIAASWYLVDRHEARPHADAVHHRELEAVVHRIDRIELKVDALLIAEGINPQQVTAEVDKHVVGYPVWMESAE